MKGLGFELYNLGAKESALNIYRYILVLTFRIYKASIRSEVFSKF